MMDPKQLKGKEFVIELARRTRFNLEKYSGDYEVTQLINSFTGLLVLPKETFFDQPFFNDSLIDAKALKKLKNSIKYSRKNGKDDSKNDDLKNIIRKIRNGICHGGVSVNGTPSNYLNDPIAIDEIIIEQDYKKGNYKQEFSITLSKDFLKDLLFQLLNGIIGSLE